MQLARPSYSDMAALIELGENLLFKCFNFDFVVPLFWKAAFLGLLSTTVFFGFTHGLGANLPVL